jgi:hypothetical protein
MLYPLSGPESVSTLMCIKDVPGLYHMDGRECQGHAWTLLQVRGRELENLVGAFKEVRAEEGEVDAPLSCLIITQYRSASHRTSPRTLASPSAG